MPPRTTSKHPSGRRGFFSIDTTNPVPTDLTATAASTTEIDLAWTDTSPNAAGYIVQSSPDGTDNSWTTLTTTPLSATTYSTATRRSRAKGRFCWYRVMAIGVRESSGYTDPVPAVRSSTRPPTSRRPWSAAAKST